MQQTRETFDSIVVRSIEELFAAYQVQLVPATDVTGTEEVAFAGIIGFTGRSIRGTLVLAPTRSLLESSHHASPGALRDWAGELANQLIGRIKNRLRGYGLEIHVTTPVILKGMSLAPLPRGDLGPYRFASATGSLSVWFDVEVGEEVRLVACDVPAGLVEGDAVIF